MLGKNKIISTNLNRYKYINIFINWYVNGFNAKYLDHLHDKKTDEILLLYLLSKENGKLIYPEYYSNDYLEIIKYLFEKSKLKNTFIVSFLYFVGLHCGNFEIKNTLKLKRAFLFANSIDSNNPYLYSYYARYLIRTLGNIYKKSFIINKGIKYLLYSINKLNNKDKYIYWRIASGYLYLKEYDKTVLFSKKSIRKGIDITLDYLQLARGYVYGKIDIDKGIKFLKGIEDYRSNKTLAIAYMYKGNFKESKKYIYKFLKFLLSRGDIFIEKEGIFYKKITNIDISNNKKKKLLFNDLANEKYINGKYRIINGEGIEELCYYNYNNISDFSIIK